MLPKLNQLLSPIRASLDEVTHLIRENVQSSDAIHKKNEQYLNAMKGKQLRAILVLWSSCQKGKTLKPEVLHIAAAIEMIHNATLIHDDVIDHARIRRGTLSLSGRWGNAPAVLFGDRLLAKAFEILVSHARSNVMKEIVQTVSKVCVGEIQQHQNAFKKHLSRAHYFEIIGSKTASLFSACCYVGALSGKLSARHAKAMKNFGFSLGMAYQIIDDCMDLVTPAKSSGKTNFRDLSEGKITLPILILLESCSPSEKKTLKSHLFDLKGPTRRLFRKCIRETDCIEQSLVEARAFLVQAGQHLDSIQNLHYKKELHLFLDLLETPLKKSRK